MKGKPETTRMKKRASKRPTKPKSELLMVFAEWKGDLVDAPARFRKNADSACPVCDETVFANQEMKRNEIGEKCHPKCLEEPK